MFFLLAEGSVFLLLSLLRDRGCLALLSPTREEEEIREPVPNAGLHARTFPSPSRQARGEIAAASSLKPSRAMVSGSSFPARCWINSDVLSRSVLQGSLTGKLKKVLFGR